MNTNKYLEAYYNEYDEENRLVRNRVGQVEYLTTRKYIDEYLTSKDIKILEVGAGTGRYSVTLAKEGYEVTAVELVEHNLEILKAKLDGTERITPLQGNALDLTAFDDNIFDLTLVLGPMYHLYTKEEKVTALKEAVRVTKQGGHIFVAYCMNEATVIQYVFGCNQLHSLIESNMITDDWRCVSEPKDLFEMVRLEEIDSINEEVKAKRVTIIATDGASRYIRDYLESVDDEMFEQWLSYHYATCERLDLIGATNHSIVYSKRYEIKNCSKAIQKIPNDSLFTLE